MAKRRQKRSASQIILWAMSLVIAGSMVLSLVLVALPGQPAPTPTPFPTWTPAPLPTLTPVSPSPQPSATPSPAPSPTEEATEPPIGPELPTDTPAVEVTEPPIGPELPTDTPEVTPTVTITPTGTITPSGSSPDLIFAVAGDSRDGPGIYSQVLESIMANGSEFLVHTGDLVNRGTESQWQAFEERMAAFTLPFYPVPGNHDGLDGGLEGYLQHSGAPAPHFSFDRAVVHFALADSHHGGVTAAELDWLRDDLSATSQPVKMVVLHHPPFDPDGTDHIMAFGNDEFMALMSEQDVDYVLAGHIHAYAQEERDGVVYVITGGAGAPLYRMGHPQAFHHYLRVTVWGEEVTIEVVKI